MDDEKFKDWQHELENRRESSRAKRIPLEERQPDQYSCHTKRGGLTRHGHPCLNEGKPQYGGGCWRHPAEGFEEAAEGPKTTARPFRDSTMNLGAKGGARWQVINEMIADEGITLEEFVERLSPEELARGQLRSPDGVFRGAPPKWVPRAFMQACVKELMGRGRRLYQENYEEAVQIMIDLAHSPDVESSVRMRAAQFVIERIEGKTPDRIVVETKDSFAARVEELELAIADNDQLRRVKERLSDQGPAASA